MIFNVANGLVLIGVFYGWLVRRRVERHVRVMKTCFVLDLALLLAVEVFRGAIEKTLGIASKPDDLNVTMLWIHIPFAVLSMVFWIVQWRTGNRILAGDRTRVAAHKRNAVLFVILRTGNLVTALLLRA